MRVAKVVVDVMPKPEILDPQGQAVADDETLERVAATLLANPVIEDWVVTRA
jgi:phosphoribosylformylglycinamidine (FGAM) synthase PurS component